VGVVDEFERLRDELERLGAPIVRYLRPGVAASEAVARVRDATGLELPPDAAAWFAWQGGVDQHDPALAPHSLNGWVLLSLGDAISEYRRWLSMASSEGQVDPRWDTRWLPLTQDAGGTPMMVVCGGDRDGQVDLIYYQDRDLIGHTYPSFEWVVAAWVSFLHDGIWDYDHQAGRWVREPLRLRGDERWGLA
jgi:cell wall assembly regulator SMI1